TGKFWSMWAKMHSPVEQPGSDAVGKPGGGGELDCGGQIIGPNAGSSSVREVTYADMTRP
ncbi:MAG: hypothetical protein WBD91_06210, partial [Acidobacteriaceae bacterium]